MLPLLVLSGFKHSHGAENVAKALFFILCKKGAALTIFFVNATAPFSFVFCGFSGIIIIVPFFFTSLYTLLSSFKGFAVDLSLIHIYMLPFVIGGGILIALAFLIDTIAGAPRDGNFGTYTQAAAFFKTIGGAAFNFMLPVLAGYIARSIADRPGLAVGFVGGYIATIGCTFANISGDASAVSGFIGALIAGFVAGFIVLLLKKIFSFLPSSLESMMPVLIIPLLGVFLIGAFMCLINPVVGALNTAISDGLNSMGSMSQILLGCLLGGMMAIDMGGPFNKAAYVFGTAAIASGGFNIMAAVMIGGMVPPIAIALATTFFKNKFTDEERNAGVVNYIMGLCFITEGAIPFAASDPVRVIPSCIAGSAIAGGISMACLLYTSRCV